ncbi:MAG: excinuclease ABC subunit UvrB [bacterium]|uniref:UvrABC system protein B n=1 Tax=Candidatus Infernicultor aquiphilus TaxID=1805029 RepID=A0A1J5GNR2_9BACT|nr:excinuclease ABC subunit UvrB [bacterium]OIP74485.1 MAG: excinuclease ABC subunit B [Candidatus Atribacteria bacterium CG2_30_33_13]PJB56115.1 MAG: excinuclease ABC subunit B [Candidatus Atribacteria bacterium CG_4_9_14_3_um_filter_33_16]
MTQNFDLVSDYPPQGDQPQAIKKLIEGINNNYKYQTLLGVTGSGKTFTMANVIQEIQLPTLVISHNKTLAAQLCSEFRRYFPNNAVEYFVSYYDYYQPEAYIPRTDTYIEKDSSINEEIDRLRLSATSSLLERRDVIIVASVSCIYGLGSPQDYKELVLTVNKNEICERYKIMERLINIHYERNDVDFHRGCFRIRGDVIEIFPSYLEYAFRIELWGDKIEVISKIDPLTGKVIERKDKLIVYPAKHFVTTKDKLERAVLSIEEELRERLKYFKKEGKHLEAQRLEERTKYDLEMLIEVGYCSGIENYSRHISGRKSGEPPATLLDYFPSDFLMFVDESHVTIPQLRGMFAGDKSRKDSLINYGFRLPSAYDNRPLYFKEIENYMKKVIFVSATPAKYELERGEQVVEQIIRPTGLVDPEVILKPIKNQMDSVIEEIKKRTEKKERVLVTTLTKRMAENLAEYLEGINIKVRYLHSEIETLERINILKDLRLGKFDVLVGVNLLREGLDLPEVSLVAILDADKEGFLRSETSLIQTMGRASRNINGTVILYCQNITGSIERAIKETNRRRKIQLEYNHQYSVIPQTIIKPIEEFIRINNLNDLDNISSVSEESGKYLSQNNLSWLIKSLEKEMIQAAKNLDFERAALLRDEIRRLKKEKTLFGGIK